MTALYFGASDRPLFGVYLPPRAARARSSGVVLCHPYGWEYLRTHRAFRQLAARLSDVGFHVFRFDYSGTGDSGGDGYDVGLHEWQEDVSTAVDELKDTAGVRTVSLVGLRLGATLAALVAASRSDIDRVVLWDPVVDGSGYVDQLATDHTRIEAAAGHALPARAAGALDLAGFPLSVLAAEQLAGIDLLSLQGLAGASVLTVTTEAAGGHDRLARVLEERGVEVELRRIEDSTQEGGPDMGLSTVLPVEVLDVIVTHLVTERNAQP